MSYNIDTFFKDCPVILDGGLGSGLAEKGFNIHDDPLWSAKVLIENPEAILQLHKEYIKCGAKILTTSSYQATIEGFKKFLNLSPEESKRKILQSIQLAKKAIDLAGDSKERYFVAGSIGPYGVSLHDGSEYHGNYVNDMTIEQLIEWHRPQMECLAQSECDLIAMETVPASKEGQALLKLLKSFPDKKAWLSFSCKDSHHTSHGEPLGKTVLECLKEVGSSQIAAIGVNCTSPEYVASLIQDIRNVLPQQAIIVYPNSGESWQPGFGWEAKPSYTPFNESQVFEWLDAKLSVIGGCCRIGPKDIKQLTLMVEKWKNS